MQDIDYTRKLVKCPNILDLSVIIMASDSNERLSPLHL